MSDTLRPCQSYAQGRCDGTSCSCLRDARGTYRVPTPMSDTLRDRAIAAIELSPAGPYLTLPGPVYLHSLAVAAVLDLPEVRDALADPDEAAVRRAAEQLGRMPELDNHHNADVCPYCNIGDRKSVV